MMAELSSTMVIIMADMKEPWNINQSIQNWLDITEKAVLAALDESSDTNVEEQLMPALQKFLQVLSLWASMWI